jgi:hypothetical protein
VSRWRAIFTAGVLAAATAAWLLSGPRPPPRDGWEDHAVAPLPAIEPDPETHEVAGRVADAAGQPLADALVAATSAGEPSWCFSAADGSFVLRHLHPGALSAWVVQPGFRPAEILLEVPATAPALVVLEAWEPVEPLPPVERSAWRGTLAGREVLAGCEVAVLPLGFPDQPAAALSGAVARRAVADAQGNFAFDDLAHGRYRVAVLPPWAAGGSWPELASFELEHAAARLDQRVELAGGSVAGALRDARGQVVPGALVELATALAPARVFPAAISDPGGRFAVEDVPAGEYVLTLRASEARLERRLTLRPGEHLELELTDLETTLPAERSGG